MIGEIGKLRRENRRLRRRLQPITTTKVVAKKDIIKNKKFLVKEQTNKFSPIGPKKGASSSSKGIGSFSRRLLNIPCGAGDSLSCLPLQAFYLSMDLSMHKGNSFKFRVRGVRVRAFLDGHHLWGRRCSAGVGSKSVSLLLLMCHIWLLSTQHIMQAERLSSPPAAQKTTSAMGNNRQPMALSAYSADLSSDCSSTLCRRRNATSIFEGMKTS